MTSEPDTVQLSIIIVNWNSQDHLRRCLASILQYTRSLCEVLVIDSASFDGCDRMLREEYPEVRFIQSHVNLGFARANNRAFAEARGDVVLFLNPDTELVGAAIDTMYDRLKALPDAGAISCRLLNSDGTVQSSCIQSIPTILNQLLNSEFLRARCPRSRLWGAAALHDDSTEPAEVEAVSGACLMARTNTFRVVGMFSEEYFMYAEDMDLSYKMRAAGYRNYYVPDAVVIHHGGSSSELAASTFSAVMLPEAIRRFLRKTRGGLYSEAYRAAMFASAVVRLALLGGQTLFRGATSSSDASRRKWSAVLRWSLKCDGLVERYYRPRRSPLYSR